MPAETDPTWYTAQKEHEGFPLFLRWPATIDLSEIRLHFQKLVVVTHKLSEVQSNGLPVPDYNETLEDFDVDLSRYPVSQGFGFPVLIETFGGNRAYYFYFKEEADLEDFREHVTSTWPDHELEWFSKSDGQGGFIQRYLHGKLFPEERNVPSYPFINA